MAEPVRGFRGVSGCEARSMKVSRSLSYTGCWTCRKRRVKCDERPLACKTCEEAQLVCAGYDVRLIWNSGRNGRFQKQRESRRQIKLDRSTCHLMTEDEVMETITSIDKSANNLSMTTVGPFSVFSVRPSSHSDPASAGAKVEKLGSPEISPIERTYNNCVRLSPESQSHDRNSGGECQSIFTDELLVPVYAPLTVDVGRFHNSPNPLTSETGVNEAAYSEQNPIQISNRTPGLELLADVHLLDDIFNVGKGRAIGLLTRDSFAPEQIAPMQPNVNNITSQTTLPSDQWSLTSLNGAELLPQSQVLMKLDDLSMVLVGNTTAAMLIDHYTKHMVHLMQPVFHQGNPFRTIYLRLAMEGSSGLEDARRPDRNSGANVAVFHSLLSTAAINLHGLQPGENGLQQLACHHKQRALVALRSALATQSGSYRDLMTAILSLVSADIFNGGTHDHWIHLEAAIQLQASRHYASLLSRETRQLNSICRMLRLFAQTALFQPEPKPWPTSGYVINDDDLDSLEPSIEFIYGITPSIARAILKIYRLTQHIAYYPDREYPQALLQSCEKAGDELSSWKISSEPFSTIDLRQEPMLAIARAQARAFYHAAVIYYYRSVQNCDRKSLHVEQQATIRAMNEAEDLKLSFRGDGSLPAPIAWPAFIASCEAVGEDRQLWDKWWARVQEYRMGNYTKQQSIIQRVWAELDSNGASMDWRQALAQMHLRIIPV